MKLKINEKKENDKLYKNIVLEINKGLQIPIKSSFDSGKQILWFLSQCESEVLLYCSEKKEGKNFDNYYICLMSATNYVRIYINCVFPTDYRILKSFCILDL